MIEFTAEYETGFEDIDDQHRKLFDTLNSLEKDIEEGSEELVLPKTVEFLKNYVLYHFNYEEGCMQKHNCPVAAKNKDQHDKLIDLVCSLEAQLANEGPTQALALEIHTELSMWLLEHIKRVDIHLRDCKSH